MRRKVVGESEIVTERIKKEIRTKNTLKQTIEKVTVKAIKLECGHLVAVTRYKKVPKNNTTCWRCFYDEIDTRKTTSTKRPARAH